MRGRPGTHAQTTNCDPTTDCSGSRPPDEQSRLFSNYLKFYIDGTWVDPVNPRKLDVINPATEDVAGQVSLGGPTDLNRAVVAAKAAFPAYAKTNKAERIELLETLIQVYRRHEAEIAASVTAEMGAPLAFARSFHAVAPVETLLQAIATLKAYDFEETKGTTTIVREPIGVCGLITPWNEPIGAIVWKAAPALAAGCTVVVKPSELAPLSAILWAEVIHEAGVPRGIFNLVNGEGSVVGHALAAHPDVAMVAFTGSTRSGILVAQTAADTVKRVQQELGGKSANIVLPDVDLESVVAAGVRRCFKGGGQSCQAPTRMLVHRAQQQRAHAIAQAAAEGFKVGDPLNPETDMGPVANKAQYEKIQRLIATGIEEGGLLVTGGLGRPPGLTRGFFVRPTVFGNVDPNSTIAKEEVFGPVLSIIPYDTEEEAISIANDTCFGLAGWVYSGSLERARRVAMELRTGRVYLNGAPDDPVAPFGGYKQSGNGREGGTHGLEGYLETKALLGSLPRKT